MDLAVQAKSGRPRSWLSWKWIWLSWEWIWLFWEWILAVLGEDLAGLGVDLPGCLRVDLAVLGVDLPVSGNVAVWEWYFAAKFGGEFRFWQ